MVWRKGADLERSNEVRQIDRRTVAKSLALVATAPFVRRVDRARAANTGAVRLPSPTGPHRIGVTTLYLVDQARRDPWVSTVAVREVMASVFYPAQSVHGTARAAQMTAGTAQAFSAFASFQYGLPAAGVDWAATRTSSFQDAPARSVACPVVLYSPGGADSRFLGTSVAEELASHGYVVVTVDHPGDANAVEFPGTTEYRDELVRQTVFRADPRTDPEVFRTMIDSRIADLRFVLDAVHKLAGGGNPDALGRPLPENLQQAIDVRRIGVYGHSAGGTAAAQAIPGPSTVAARRGRCTVSDRRTRGGPAAAPAGDRRVPCAQGDPAFLGENAGPPWATDLLQSALGCCALGVHRPRRDRPPTAGCRTDDRREPDRTDRPDRSDYVGAFGAQSHSLIFHASPGTGAEVLTGP
jgi:dienelactone hydrolase